MIERERGDRGVGAFAMFPILGLFPFRPAENMQRRVQSQIGRDRCKSSRSQTTTAKKKMYDKQVEKSMKLNYYTLTESMFSSLLSLPFHSTHSTYSTHGLTLRAAHATSVCLLAQNPCSMFIGFSLCSHSLHTFLLLERL